MTFIVQVPAPHCRLGIIGLVLLGLLLLGASAAHSTVTARADDPGFSEVARQVEVGRRLRVSGLLLETRGEVELDLDRFEVFTADTLILAGDKPVEIPDTAYFRGSIVGSPETRVVLGFRSEGVIEGLITGGDEVWQISSRVRLSGLGAQRLSILEEFEDRPFDCQTQTSPIDDFLFEPAASDAEGSDHLPAGTYSYSARVAVDTDWEFLNKFDGDVSAATNYVADLFAYSSTIYEAEVDTSLYISYLK